MAVDLETMTMPQLSEYWKATWGQFTKINDDRLKTIEKQLGGTAGFDEKLHKIEETLHAMEKAMDKIQAGRSEPPPAPAPKESELRAKAFDVFLHKGVEGLGPDQVKVLRQSDDTGGGYLCPPEYVQEIIKTVIEYSPMRELARVRPTSKVSTKVQKRIGTFSAVWVAEQGTRSETAGLKYGQEDMPNHEMSAIVDISFSDLEDADFDLEAEIRQEVGEQFGVAEGTAFMSGTGRAKPEGILVSTAITNRAGTDSTAHYLQPDDLIFALGDLKNPYANNATFVLKRSVLFRVRTVKAATTGEYLMLPFASGMPPNILGRPFRTDENMEADGAASKIVALVGDFRRGYLIGDRVPIALVRDPYTQAASGNVRFTARKRVGGQVVLGEAIVKVTTA